MEIFQKSAGYGAIFELTRILDTMRRQMHSEKDLSFSPGLLLAGTLINYSKDHFGLIIVRIILEEKLMEKIILLIKMP